MFEVFMGRNIKNKIIYPLFKLKFHDNYMSSCTYLYMLVFPYV